MALESVFDEVRARAADTLSLTNQEPKSKLTLR